MESTPEKVYSPPSSRVFPVKVGCYVICKIITFIISHLKTEDALTDSCGYPHLEFL